MDPQQAFCPNADCPARGQVGKGNIWIHSRTEHRYRCTVCQKTFSATAGTLFYRAHVAKEIITLVITLIAHGCPVSAIVAAFGFQARTVRGWIEAAGLHCEKVHHHQVVQPRDLGQVQADEIRAKIQNGIVWVAMAIMVSTRLWLGGVISPHRDRTLIRTLAGLIKECALPLPILLCVDGLSTYVDAFRKAFRTAMHKARKGRPRLVAWKDVLIGQVVKQYQRRRVVGVGRRLVQGTWQKAWALIEATQGKGVLNTAYIERLNATFRARLATLVRRTRGLARRTQMLHAGMYLIGTVYNFCSYHDSLTTQQGDCRTPAMAAGITDHCWSMAELLEYRVPLPRWWPPKRRGRRSKAMQELSEKWAA